MMPHINILTIWKLYVCKSASQVIGGNTPNQIAGFFKLYYLKNYLR